MENCTDGKHSLLSRLFNRERGIILTKASLCPKESMSEHVVLCQDHISLHFLPVPSPLFPPVYRCVSQRSPVRHMEVDMETELVNSVASKPQN